MQRLYQRVFVDWDWTMVDELVDPTFVSHDWPAGLEGPAGFRAFYERALLANAPPTGRPLTLEGMAIYRVQDDRLMERWVVLDGLGSAERLRADP